MNVLTVAEIQEILKEKGLRYKYTNLNIHIKNYTKEYGQWERIGNSRVLPEKHLKDFVLFIKAKQKHYNKEHKFNFEKKYERVQN